ncbi:MAG: glycosyltransferase family 39 protein [Candidatus Aureabacteria bacterium]|nr:glycosyltransferase family 39 protein [Candidatus Auribacterota bacterium]
MGFEIEFVYTWLQFIGEWTYRFCASHQEGLAWGIGSLTLVLLALCAIRSRRFFNPAMWILLGAGSAFLGQLALRDKYFQTGVALYASCAVFVFVYCALVRGQYGLREMVIGTNATILFMIIIIACAALERFYNLGNRPNGFNNDEALFSYYGLLTMRGEALHGWWAGPSRYLVAHLYGLALVFKLFGVSIATARSASGIIGIISVVACFLMADKLFKRGVALLAASSLAICFCCTGFDRLAICLNWGTPFACLGVYFLLLADNKGKQYYGFLSGFILGFGIWTYDVYKGGLLAIGIFIFFRILFGKGYLRRNWAALILLGIGFVVATGPLLKGQKAYAIGYMKQLFAFIGSPALPKSGSHADLLLINVKLFLRMLFLNMSESIHLVRNGPMFNDALVPLFLIGFVSALYNWKRYNYFLLLVWFLVSPIGGILSWPCTRRIIIFMPAVHILIALGALLLFKNIGDSIGLSRKGGLVAALLIMIVIIYPVNAYIYFNQSQAYSQPDLKEVGDYVDSQIGKRYVYLMDVEPGTECPPVYVMTYDKRRGEDPKRFYKYITGEEMYDCIFNSPARDSEFVIWNNMKIPENEKRITSVARAIPLSGIERKQYLVVCTIDEKGLTQWRGVKVSYRKLAQEGRPAEWAAAKTDKTEFDWGNYLLPYPFEAVAEGSFYVPKDYRYEFQVVGNGETTLYIDGDVICGASSCERYLKEGAHEIYISNVQRGPGTLSITWGAHGKPRSPIYLWSDIIEQLCGGVPETSGEITVMDDGDKTFSIKGGNWETCSDSNAFEGSLHWHHRGKGESSARWASEVPRDGYYEVFAIWRAGDNRATNAPYHIIHDEGEEVRRVNQKKDGGRWVSLGTYPFSKGNEFEISLSNDADEEVIADAVKIEYRREMQQ